MFLQQETIWLDAGQARRFRVCKAPCAQPLLAMQPYRTPAKQDGAVRELCECEPPSSYTRSHFVVVCVFLVFPQSRARISDLVIHSGRCIECVCVCVCVSRGVAGRGVPLALWPWSSLREWELCHAARDWTKRGGDISKVTRLLIWLCSPLPPSSCLQRPQTIR